MKLGKLSLLSAAVALACMTMPTSNADAHGRHWRSHGVRVVYRSVPRYRVVYRPRYYSTYAYRPYRYYDDGYYGGGYRYRPGFALRIGHRGGFLGFGGSRLWW